MMCIGFYGISALYYTILYNTVITDVNIVEYYGILY